MKPKGLEHQERDYAVVKITHEAISTIQKQYPKVAEEMLKDRDNATNTFIGFLLLLALKNGNPKFPEIENKVLDDYKIIDKRRRTGC